MLEIKVQYDLEEQAGKIDFEAAGIKTWDLVVMMLEDALSKAKFQQNLGRMQMVQQQAAQAMQDQSLRQGLLNGGLRGHN